MESSYDDLRLEEREAGASGPQSEHGAGRSSASQQPLQAGSADKPRQSNAEVLKVSTRSRPSAVAGAIAGVIRESGVAEVQSIGAGATNQAIKAIAIARSYLNEEGLDIVCTPSFIDVAIDDEERTAIRMLILRRDQVT
jgi:stage V sporulation protein S